MNASIKVSSIGFALYIGASVYPHSHYMTLAKAQAAAARILARLAKEGRE